MTKMRSLLTMLAMVVLLAIGLGYILVAVIQIDPFNRPMRVTVNAARSGGLLDHSQVTYRGFPVGRVSAIGWRSR
jgi:ABC-type transporter Mla subunit MlaD